MLEGAPSMRLKVAGAYWLGSARFATRPENPIPPDKRRPVCSPRPRYEETTSFRSDPLCRAVRENLVAADRKVAPATFMLRHVLARTAMIAMTTSNSIRVKARSFDKNELALIQSLPHKCAVRVLLSLVPLPVIGPDGKPLKGHSWIRQKLSRSHDRRSNFFWLVLADSAEH